MKKFICMPMTRWPMLGGACGTTSFFTTNEDRIRRLTARRPMQSISTDLLKPGQPNLNQAEFHLKILVPVQHPETSAIIMAQLNKFENMGLADRFRLNMDILQVTFQQAEPVHRSAGPHRPGSCLSAPPINV